MKGILIDPYERTVAGVLIGEDYRDIYRHLKCQTFDCIVFDQGNTLWIDDEYLFTPEEDRAAFSFTDDNDPKRIIGGRGLLLGHNSEGASVDTDLSAKYIGKIVEWRDPNDLPEPGFTIEFMDSL